MNFIIEAWNSIARVWWPWCLHSTWQGLVLLVLVLVMLPLLRRVSPHWRYALLFVALLKFVLPPLGMEGVGLFAWLFPPAGVTVSDPSPLNRFQFQIVSIENYVVDTSPVPVSAPKSSLHPLTPAGWGLLVHAVGSVFLAGFLASQVVRLRLRLKRSQRITEGPLFKTVVSVGRLLKLRRSSCVYVSEESESPCAGGVFQKFVLLPGWVNLLTDEERRVLVAHELAHLKRWDTFCNWFQILSQVWLWWNPAVWWLNSRIRAERELCCDDLVLSLGFAAGGDYSRLLVDVANRQQNPELAFEAMGMADSFRRLKERIDRAMDSSLRRRTRLSLVSAAVLVVIAVAVLPGIKINSQTVPDDAMPETNAVPESAIRVAETSSPAVASVASATSVSSEVRNRADRSTIDQLREMAVSTANAQRVGTVSYHRCVWLRSIPGKAERVSLENFPYDDTGKELVATYEDDNVMTFSASGSNSLWRVERNNTKPKSLLDLKTVEEQCLNYRAIMSFDGMYYRRRLKCAGGSEPATFIVSEKALSHASDVEETQFFGISRTLGFLLQTAPGQQISQKVESETGTISVVTLSYDGFKNVHNREVLDSALGGRCLRMNAYHTPLPGDQTLRNYASLEYGAFKPFGSVYFPTVIEEKYYEILIEPPSFPIVLKKVKRITIYNADFSTPIMDDVFKVHPEIGDIVYDNVVSDPPLQYKYVGPATGASRW